jgi:hypothetical protein
MKTGDMSMLVAVIIRRSVVGPQILKEGCRRRDPCYNTTFRAGCGIKNIPCLGRRSAETTRSRPCAQGLARSRRLTILGTRMSKLQGTLAVIAGASKGI